MHCDKCGKENRENSKFCRSCGISLAEETTNPIVERKSIKEFKIDWKNPIVLLIIGLIVALGLFWGGSNAYGYFKVSSKINKAEKLLIGKDYASSLETLNSLEFGAGTVNQKQEITKLKEDNKKFSDYKALFDITVAKIGATSTVTDLKQAQKDLQSIDSTYPDYESVKTKLTEIGGLLMTALENDSAASKALAEKNRQAAATAQAAAATARQQAIDTANTSAYNAKIAKEAEISKSFTNQLYAAYKNLNNGVDYYNSANSYYNAGNFSMALIEYSSARAVYSNINEVALDINKTFTGMPQSYVDAANNLAWAAYEYVEAIDLAVEAIADDVDNHTNVNKHSTKGNLYKNLVLDFINSL